MLQVMRTVDRAYADATERVCILGLSVDQADDLWFLLHDDWFRGLLAPELDPVFRKLAEVLDHASPASPLRTVGDFDLEGTEP